ncbi:MAG: M81 family metallopeptidase [bacterium]|nr:M81 family metallopeptidase [bacterium]
MRIGIAALWHETNTFAVEHNSTLEHVHIREGEDLLASAHPKSFVGGFAEAANRPNMELVPTVDIRFAHGGLIHADIYKHCCRLIVNGLSNAAPLDAIFLALHGAMVAEDPYTDAEGELVRELRNTFGNDIPIVATYDFHAIMSDFESEALVPFPNNTNPHIDGYERGLEAAECLLRMLAGEIHPVTQRVFVPILGPNIGQSTWSHILQAEERLLLYRLNLKREKLEQTPGVLNLSILGGYGYGDSPDAGMCVLATTDNNPELAQRLASELARDLWTRREDLLSVRPIHAIDEGVQMAIARQDKPILLVDLGDDPGSACAADSPAVLESLIRHNARNCALTIRDPEVVRAGIEAGVGATITLDAGGKFEQRFYKPLTVTGTVKTIDDGTYTILGPTHGGWGRDIHPDAFREAHVGPRVVLRIGNKIDVIFSQHRTGKDRDFFKSIGIIPEEKQILVVKSNQAHRASFDPIVAETIELNTPGASTVNYTSLPYRHLKRPIWPLDLDMEWNGESI